MPLAFCVEVPAPLIPDVAFATSGFFAPPLRVSAKKISPLSLMPLAFCVEVPAPLIPDVAFVELPPQKGDLSRQTQRPPCSRTVWAAEKPARPPPTTMHWCAGKTCAIFKTQRKHNLEP